MVFYFSNYSFQIWWLIRGMEVMKKIHNYKKYISISKIMPARPKQSKDMGMNTPFYTTSYPVTSC